MTMGYILWWVIVQERSSPKAGVLHVGDVVNVTSVERLNGAIRLKLDSGLWASASSSSEGTRLLERTAPGALTHNSCELLQR
jgi:hypothetical protein